MDEKKGVKGMAKENLGYLVFGRKVVGELSGEEVLLYSERARETLSRLKAVHYAVSPEGEMIPLAEMDGVFRKVDFLRRVGVGLVDSPGKRAKDSDGRWLEIAIVSVSRDFSGKERGPGGRGAE